MGKISRIQMQPLSPAGGHEPQLKPAHSNFNTVLLHYNTNFPYPLATKNEHKASRGGRQHKLPPCLHFPGFCFFFIFFLRLLFLFSPSTASFSFICF